METPRRRETGRPPAAQFAPRPAPVQDGTAARCGKGDGEGGGSRPDLQGAGRGRRRVPGADRAVPPRTPGALLPNARLLPGRRGRRPKHAAGRLARPRPGSRNAPRSAPGCTGSRPTGASTRAGRPTGARPRSGTCPGLNRPSRPGAARSSGCSRSRRDYVYFSVSSSHHIWDDRCHRRPSASAPRRHRTRHPRVRVQHGDPRHGRQHREPLITERAPLGQGGGRTRGVPRSQPGRVTCRIGGQGTIAVAPDASSESSPDGGRPGLLRLAVTGRLTDGMVALPVVLRRVVEVARDMVGILLRRHRSDHPCGRPGRVLARGTPPRGGRGDRARAARQ